MTKTNSIAAKLSVAVVAVAMAFTLVAPAAKAQDVSSMSLDQLVALVNSLQAQLSGSASVGSCSYTFTRSLSTGSTGADVMNLQKFLNMSADTQVAAAGSAGGPGSETSYYGPATAAAVSKFQVKYSADILVPVGLTSPTGYFGPSSMAKANAVCAGMTDGGDDDDDTDNGDLEGGAGDISEAEFITSLNNEEVGEGDEDVEVAGLEIEADGSDIEIAAVTLDFDYADSGASDDFDDYASEVSVWLDGEELARVDVSDMDDDDWSENISLDNGGIIREGEVGDLVVAVSGVSNIDGTDEGENWNVAIESVRFRDAQGATVTDSSTDDITDGNEDTTTDAGERAFSFESFATASDLEIKVSSADDAINDARSIEVSSTTETDGVEIMSFEIEVEGNSDVTIDDVPVNLTSVGADVDAIANSVELVVDGDVIATENIASTATTTSEIVFDNIDWVVEAGETVEVIVRVDLNELTGTFTQGDTLLASVNPDEDSWDIEDEEGETVSDNDKSGTATSDAHAFYADGIQVTFVSATDSETSVDSTDNDYVTLTIKFEVTAFGEDAYIPNFASSTVGTSATGATALTTDGVLVHLQSADAGLAVGAVSETLSSTADEESNSFLVQEGQTEEFTVRAVVSNSATSTLDNADIRMILAGVAFGDSDSATGDLVFTSNLDTFKTDYAHIAD